MILTHKHNDNRKLKNEKFTTVGSGAIGISTKGDTLFWSSDLGGCICVVMCGGSKKGVFAHINQMIQTGDRDLKLALKTCAEFFKEQTGETLQDVLLYFGDPGINKGKKGDLDAAKVKQVMGCKNLIDLRRVDEKNPYGHDFIYDPGKQCVYTFSADKGVACEAMGAGDLPEAKRNMKDYKYKDDATKKAIAGYGTKGYFIVD